MVEIANQTRDFWVGTEDKLTRMQVVPCKNLFNPAEWNTSMIQNKSFVWVGHGEKRWFSAALTGAAYQSLGLANHIVRSATYAEVTNQVISGRMTNFWWTLLKIAATLGFIVPLKDFALSPIGSSAYASISSGLLWPSLEPSTGTNPPETRHGIVFRWSAPLTLCGKGSWVHSPTWCTMRPQVFFGVSHQGKEQKQAWTEKKWQIVLRRTRCGLMMMASRLMRGHRKSSLGAMGNVVAHAPRGSPKSPKADCVDPFADVRFNNYLRGSDWG